MSYYDVGRQSGKLVVRVLKGEKPGEIVPEIGQTLRLVLNTEAAKKQGVTLSPEVIQSAYKVINQ